jgi:hypothetical protein
MPRHAVQRLWMFCAFALAVCLPLRLEAAILQVCENDAVSLAPIEADFGFAPRCELMAGADDAAGDAGPAPLCDPRGASAVAPPRIHPIADARIEAAGCGEGERRPSVEPSSRDPVPAGDIGGSAHDALSVPDLALPPAPTEAVLPAFFFEGGPRAGHRPGVYHPPR